MFNSLWPIILFISFVQFTLFDPLWYNSLCSNLSVKFFLFDSLFIPLWAIRFVQFYLFNSFSFVKFSLINSFCSFVFVQFSLFEIKLVCYLWSFVVWKGDDPMKNSVDRVRSKTKKVPFLRKDTQNKIVWRVICVLSQRVTSDGIQLIGSLLFSLTKVNCSNTVEQTTHRNQHNGQL